MIGTLPGPWFLIAATLLLALAGKLVQRAGAPGVPGADLWVVAVLVVLATTARLALGPWGPLHVNGQGPLWIRGAFDATALAGYGPGYFELFGWAARFGVVGDRAIFAANALLSGLAPGLLYLTARLVGVARNGALAVSMVIAADPVSSWTAASESYLSALIALVLAVQTALALGVRAHQCGERTARNLAFVAAALLAASAARIHPMSYLPLALCPLVVLGAAQPGLRTRLGLAIAAAAVIALGVAATSLEAILTALRASSMTNQAFTGIVARDYSLLIAPLVLALLLRRWLRPAWLPLLGVASCALMIATQNAFQQSALWKLWYQRNYLPGILLGVSPLFPARLRHPAWAAVAAAGGVALLVRSSLPSLPGATTEQLEYRFLQHALRDMAPNCMLAAVSHAGIRIWEIPSFLLPDAAGQRAVTSAADLASAPGDCLLYFRSSLCSSVEGRAPCEAVERDGRLELMARQTFPAVPSYTGLPYDRSEVEVALFRVSDVRPGVADGAAITPAFAQQLYDRLTTMRAGDGCRVVRLNTSRFRMTIGVEAPAGAEHTVEAATGAEAGEAEETGGWALVSSDEGRHDCGPTLTEIGRVLRDLGQPAPR